MLWSDNINQIKRLALSLIACSVLVFADPLSDYQAEGIRAYQAGDYSKAVSNYQSALEIQLKTLPEDSSDIANSYNNIGVLYHFKGDHPKALEYMKKALTIREAKLGKEHLDTANSYNNIGGLYHSMGDYPKALEYMKKTLAISEAKLGIDHTEIATIYNNISKLYKSMGDYQKALEYIKKALTIRETKLGKEHRDTATSYNNIGSLYDSIGDYHKAMEYYQKALVIREGKLGKNHHYTATSYNNIGLLYHNMGDYLKALEYYQKSLNILEKVLDKEHPSIAATYNNIGKLYNSMGNYSRAYEYSKKSYDSFIINRDKNFAILDNSQKEKYLKSNDEKIPLLFSTTYAYSKIDSNQSKRLSQTTLNDWLNYKGSIYDSENALSMLYEQTTDPVIKETIENLSTQKRALAKLYQTLPKPEEAEQYRTKIKSTEEAISSLEKELSSKASSFQAEMGLRSISYKDIAKHLKQGELYIDYAKAGENYYLFSLDKAEHIEFIQLDENTTKEIDSTVTAFRADVNTLVNDHALTTEKLSSLNASSRTSLNRLYKLALAKPLGKTLNQATNLIVSSDGALRLIPFEALYNTETGKYLLEEKNIRYIPSGKELVRLYRHSQNSTNKEVAMFSNPDFNAKGIKSVQKEEEPSITPNTSRSGIIKSLFKMHFSPLPGSKAEAENIRGILKGSSLHEYTQTEAKESNLLEIKHPKVLHIATHGFFINDESIPNPMLKSGIALSGANTSAIMGKSDGIVTSLKLSGLNLKGTDLVVLSACQTGEVDPKSTESVSGLNKAFIQAGANNVIMSLWPVADKETMELMSGFYRQIQQQDDYAESLRGSKIAMIHQGLHPYYWAPFIISGRGE